MGVSYFNEKQECGEQPRHVISAHLYIFYAKSAKKPSHFVLLQNNKIPNPKRNIWKTKPGACFINETNVFSSSSTDE